jgi:hypothetical protein
MLRSKAEALVSKLWVVGLQPNHSSLQHTYGHFSFTYSSRPQLQGRGSSSLFCTYEVFFCSDRLTSFPLFVDNYSEF